MRIVRFLHGDLDLLGRAGEGGERDVPHRESSDEHSRGFRRIELELEQSRIRARHRISPTAHTFEPFRVVFGFAYLFQGVAQPIEAVRLAIRGERRKQGVDRLAERLRAFDEVPFPDPEARRDRTEIAQPNRSGGLYLSFAGRSYR